MLKPHLPTIFPGEVRRGLQLGGLGRVQAAGEVEADPVGLFAGPPQDDSSVVLHALSGLVEEGVLGVVRHAVGDDEVEVVLELLQAPVVVGVDPCPHAGEVHGPLDVVQVVGDLQQTTLSVPGASPPLQETVSVINRPP